MLAESLQNQAEHYKNRAGLRTCVFTGLKMSQEQMWRFAKVKVYDADGVPISPLSYEIQFDPHHNLPGRGAYLKKDLEVAKHALSKGFIERKLKFTHYFTAEQQKNLLKYLAADLEASAQDQSARPSAKVRQLTNAT